MPHVVSKQLAKLSVNAYPSDLYIHCLASGGAASGRPSSRLWQTFDVGVGEGKEGRQGGSERGGRRVRPLAKDTAIENGGGGCDGNELTDGRSCRRCWKWR